MRRSTQSDKAEVQRSSTAMEGPEAIALCLSKYGHNFLLTGSAGTGKTTLIRQITSTVRQNGKKVVVTATTGMSSFYFLASYFLCGKPTEE